VRHGFSSNPVKCNFYNREGLAAAPFCSDNWAVPAEIVKTLRGRN